MMGWDGLEVAMAVAVRAHHGQRDKSGKPVILHPIRVMIGVQVHGPEAMATAVLHDVLEDTTVSETDLITAGVSVAVVQRVRLLSRLPSALGERLTYRQYIRSIRDSGDPLALAVKLQDLFDNMGRLQELPEEDRRASVRYRDAMLILGGEESSLRPEDDGA